LCSVAFASKALDGSGTLGSNGFKSGAGSGNGLGFGELRTGGSMGLCRLTIPLLKQISF
jgi:hypothetical protein